MNEDKQISSHASCFTVQCGRTFVGSATVTAHLPIQTDVGWLWVFEFDPFRWENRGGFTYTDQRPFEVLPPEQKKKKKKKKKKRTFVVSGGVRPNPPNPPCVRACLLRVSFKKKKKKKKSVSPHDSLAVHADQSERSPTLPSSSGLCVRQIENEQQSTVGEVSQRLKVMALARRPAGPDNAVPSLPGSDSWLSEKKQTKKINPKLVPARLGAATFLSEHFGCWARHAPLTLFDCVSWPVRSTHDQQCTRQASDMTCDSDVIEKPSRRWRGAVQQLADVV